MRTPPFEDPSPIPILTQTVDAPPAGGLPSDGNSPTRIASDAIRQVLGWRYRAQDLKGFQASLAKSFVPRYVDDSLTVYDWQRGGAATVDDTEITGALASFYNRAKAAIDQAVPLLNAVTPLKPDADPEDTEAIRSIILDRLQSLPSTLGVPGGPPPQRINLIFQLLLGETPENCHSSPESVGGELGIMRSRFGLNRSEVNTIDEELNLTNFVIIVDYIASLHQTWTSQARFFNRGGPAEPYLGNQLVLIKNQLDVVADSVARARTAMESVYFNLAEQTATFLDLGPDEPPITVAELLDWVLDATQLKPDQLQSKDGITAVRAGFEQLHDLVAGALNQCTGNINNSTLGFYTERVQLALDSLESSLLKALELANQIHRGPQPVIRSVTVFSDVCAQAAKSADAGHLKLCDSKILKAIKAPGLQITGQDFRRGAVVRVNPVEAPDVTFQATTVSLAVRSLAQNKQAVLFAAFNGSWDEIEQMLKQQEMLNLTVINPNGQSALFTFSQPAATGSVPPGLISPSVGPGPSPEKPAAPGGDVGKVVHLSSKRRSRGAAAKGHAIRGSAPSSSDPVREPTENNPKNPDSPAPIDTGTGTQSAPKKS